MQTRPSADNQGPEPLPEIQVNNRQLRDVSKEAMEALLEYNNPPKLFVRAGALVRIAEDEDGRPQAERIGPTILRRMLAEAASWIKAKDELVQTSVNPPIPVVENILAAGNWSPAIPSLRGIVTAPVVTPQGTLLTEPGYEPASGLYYLGQDLKLPCIGDVGEAMDLFLDELLGDFPFSDPASRAHALALLLLPFVRPLIPGHTPIHLADSPTPGSGKGLLIETITKIFTPEGVAALSGSGDGSEWRKRITSVLLGGQSHVLIDNIKGHIDSADLAAAVTATVWQDRMLNTLTMVNIPQKVVWCATGNNVTLSTEIARRTVWIRLDPEVERPWLRDGFKHPDLKAWARKNRPALVAAALTLVKAWLDAGSPKYSGKLPGSLESWASVIGGILENANELYDKLDPERESWIAFLSAWWDEYDTREVKVSDLYDLATKGDYLNEVLQGGTGNDSDRARRTRLGKALGNCTDRVYSYWQIKKVGVKHSAAIYRLSVRGEHTA